MTLQVPSFWYLWFYRYNRTNNHRTIEQLHRETRKRNQKSSGNIKVSLKSYYHSYKDFHVDDFHEVLLFFFSRSSLIP